jgi:glycosyltransferase involved in cell wall biosynthesis
MPSRPLVSIVVPAHHASETIDRCLDALSRQTVPRESYEIIVVDDGSSDGTRIRVESHAGGRLLTQARSGPAAARNLGVQHANGGIVLFTDADCEPAPDWIEQMLVPFREEQVVGVKGIYLSHQRETVARFVQIEYEDRYDRMAHQASIDFVDTYAAGYRRHILLAHGGFDPTFPEASVEDQELSFRLAEQGYTMVFAPLARVYHLGHARNPWAYFRRKFRIGYWKVMVTRKHPSKLLRDSHTPQVLKVQILLAGSGSLCLLGSVLWPPLGWGLAVSGILFLVTTLPFAFKAWPKDPVAALVSPALLLLRALALGTGFFAGAVAGLIPGAIPRAPAKDEEDLN